MASPLTESTSALNAFAAAMKAATEQITAIANSTNTQLLPGLHVFQESMKGVTLRIAGFNTAFATAGEAMMKFISGLEFLQPVTRGITDAMRSAFEKIGPILGVFEDAITSTFQGISDALLPIFGPVMRGLAAAVGVAGESVKQFASGATLLGIALVQGAQASIKFAGEVANFVRQVAQGGANLASGPMRALETGIGAIQSQVTRFVALIDPAAVFRFQFAVDSLYATIGQTLVPVLNQFAQVIRGIASAIAGTTEQGKMVIAALAAGTVGLIAFGAAVAVVQAAATGGLGPIIGALTGAVGGVLLATGKLTPLFDTLASSMSGFLDQIGGALDVATDAFTGLMPLLADFSGEMAGFASYLIGAAQRLMPAIMDLGAVFVSLAKPALILYELYAGPLVEGFVLLGKVVSFVAPAVVLLGQVMGEMLEKVQGWIRELLSLIGIDMGPAPAGGPRGATATPATPVRPAAFSSASEDLRKAQASAYSLGSGAGLSPADRATIATAAHTATMAERVGSLRDAINDLPNKILIEMKHAIDYFRGLPSRAVTAAREGLGISPPVTGGLAGFGADIAAAARELDRQRRLRLEALEVSRTIF